MIPSDTSPSWSPGTKLMCFGFGYSARALAARLAKEPLDIVGTRTRPGAGAGAGPGTETASAAGQSTPECKGAVALASFVGDAAGPSVLALLPGTTHVLVSIPPDMEGDPTLRWHGADLAHLRSLCWVGYLSTIGVYGDCGGNWIDETSPVRPQTERALRRVRAETQWADFGRSTGKRVDIFRLPGIYGPGRSVIDGLKTGTARRIVKPGQVFNRIHVADIAATVARAMRLAGASRSPAERVFNVVDDEPAPPQDVVAYAARILGLPEPPEVPFDAADLSAMARSFYSENKRVRNQRLKTTLGVTLAYPTYRDGLDAIAHLLSDASASAHFE